MKLNTPIARTLLLVPASASLLWLTGCGLGSTGGTTPRNPVTPIGRVAVQGKIFGGQQPIGGATIRMYAVGGSGYGSASTSVLNSGVTVTSATDGSGSFVLTGKYTCTTGQRLYLTASGGDAGNGPNSAIALMAGLGRCEDLTASTFISINEVTTVAAVWALAPFMSGAGNVGAPATNLTGINNAMSDVAALANLSTGTAGGGVPAGTVMPVAAINTLADILASCINSDGGSTSTCPTLFAATTVSGVVPTDTLTAALNIAQHPGQNAATLFTLTSPSAPFQPQLPEAPTSFTLAASYSNPALTSPTAVAINSTGGAWITDATTGKILAINHDGSTAATVTGLSAPSAVAVHQNGSVWVANSGNSTLTQISSAGTVTQTISTGGLNAPRGLGIDGQGNLWVVNGNSSVSEFNSSGTAITGSAISTPSTALGIALNPR